MATEARIVAAVHHALIQGYVEQGVSLTTEEIGYRLSLSADETRAALRSLEEQHGTLLDPGTGEPWITHPFSSTPTLFYVQGQTLGWWAPCIWCAFGIVALVPEPSVRIRTRLGGDGESCEIDVGPHGLAPRGLVAHFPIPPAKAWDNVHRHCACTLVFEAESDVDVWCERHRIERGDVLSLEHAARFAAIWYANHLSESWRKPSIAEARALFEEAGLTGPHWKLDGNDGRF